jgi:hypothetical protein
MRVYKGAEKIMSSKPEPKVGQLWRRGRSIRKISGLYTNIPGGVRLDEPIGDFVSWNTEELEFVAETEELS